MIGLLSPKTYDSKEDLLDLVYELENSSKREKKEYNVGDKVWWAKYESQQVKKTCPICFGKLRVRLILGDDSQVETDCTYCERGFHQYGYVMEYEYVSAVELVAIDTKEVNEDDKGRQVEYRYNHYCLDDKNTFDTKEEAEEALKDMIVKVKKKDLERLEYGKDQNPKKYSWHIGYYQRKKKDALKEIEFADRKIAYFKDRIKAELITNQNNPL